MRWPDLEQMVRRARRTYLLRRASGDRVSWALRPISMPFLVRQMCDRRLARVHAGRSYWHQRPAQRSASVAAGVASVARDEPLCLHGDGADRLVVSCGLPAYRPAHSQSSIAEPRYALKLAGVVGDERQGTGQRLAAISTS